MPGGFLTLSSNGGNALTAGNQFVIRPRTGKIMVEIGAGEAIQVNNIGKDVFGGIYQDPDSDSATAVFGGRARISSRPWASWWATWRPTTRTAEAWRA